VRLREERKNYFFKPTPWMMMPFMKPKVAKKRISPPSYETRMFIVTFNKSPLLVPVLRQIHSLHTLTFYLRSILILSSNLPLGLS